MDVIVQRVIAGTVLLIVIYYFFKDANATNQIIGGASNAYIGGVKALQGR